MMHSISRMSVERAGVFWCHVFFVDVLSEIGSRMVGHGTYWKQWKKATAHIYIQNTVAVVPSAVLVNVDPAVIDDCSLLSANK